MESVENIWSRGEAPEGNEEYVWGGEKVAVRDQDELSEFFELKVGLK